MTDAYIETIKAKLQGDLGMSKAIRELNRKSNIARGMDTVTIANTKMANARSKTATAATNYLKELLDAGLPFEEAKKKCMHLLKI